MKGTEKMKDDVKLNDLSKPTVVPPRTGHHSDVITDTDYYAEIRKSELS